MSGGSAKTESTYRGALASYTAYNGSDAIVRKTYDGYILDLKVHHRKANTIALYATILRRYADYHDINTAKWQRPKTYEPPVSPLQPNEIRMMAEACYHFKRNAEERLFVFSFLLGTGLRVSEFLALQWSDLDLERGTCNVRKGKGNKSRLIRLSKTALDATLRWFYYRYPNTGLEGAGQLPFRVSPVTTTPSIGYLLQTTAAKAGLGMRGIHPHLLRHTFAVTVTRTKALTQRSLQLHLGHASPSTTVRYQRYSVVDDSDDLANTDLIGKT